MLASRRVMIIFSDYLVFISLCFIFDEENYNQI